MRHILLAAFLLAAQLVFAAGSFADENDSAYDRISFQVVAIEEVANDTLVAIMYQERDGQKPSAIADEVNRDIAWAVDLAKRASGVKLQTLGYHQQPQYRNQTVVGWKARQSIRLESTDQKTLASLIGELQSRLSVASIQYAISPQARVQAEDRLVSEALQQFNRRGKLIAGDLGRPDFRIVAMDVSTDRSAPGPVHMRTASVMSESSVAPPTVEAGAQEVSVRVSGTIELVAPR